MTTYAGRPVFPPYFTDPSGNPQELVSITVYNSGTTVKPTLYTDRTKATPLANPFTADSLGNAEFYLDPGDYDALVNGVTLPFSVVADPAEPLDAAAVLASIPSGTYVGAWSATARNGNEVVVADPTIAKGTKLAFLGALGLLNNAKDHAATRAQRDAFGVPTATGSSTSKPLSGYYASLAEAQVDYPHAAALTDELDWAILQAAINASIGPGAPESTNRLCLNAVWVPRGSYRCNRRLHVQSVQGWNFLGAGRDAVYLEVNGPMDAFLDNDGVANGYWSDMSVRVLTGATVDRAVSLDWSGAGITNRSSSSNVFARISVSGPVKYAFAIGTRSANRQVDNTSLWSCLATGLYTRGSGEATLHQAAFRFGSGTAGNIIGNFAYNCSSTRYRYQFEAVSTNLTVHGSLPAANEVDFRHSGAVGPVSITNVRSEQAWRLWEDTSTAAVRTVTLQDIIWNGASIAADGRWISNNNAGHLKLDNVHCYSAAVTPKVYSQVVGGSASTVTAIGLAQQAPVESAFDVGGGTRVVAVGYTQIDTNNVVTKATPFWTNALATEAPWANRIDLDRVLASTRTSRLVASDDFNRADGAIGTSSSGHVWTVISGTWSVLANKAREELGTGNRVAVLDPATANIEVEVDLTVGAVTSGIALRAIDASNFLILEMSTAQNLLRFRKLDTAAFTNFLTLSTFGVVNGTTYKLGVRAFGANLRFYVNSVHVGEYTLTTADQTKFGVATRHGLYVGGDLPVRFDNLSLLS